MKRRNVRDRQWARFVSKIPDNCWPPPPGYYRPREPYRSKPRVGMRMCVHDLDHLTITQVFDRGLVRVSDGSQQDYYHCMIPARLCSMIHSAATPVPTR